MSGRGDQPTILGDWAGHVRAYCECGKISVGSARVELDIVWGWLRRQAATGAAMRNHILHDKKKNRCQNPTVVVPDSRERDDKKGLETIKKAHISL